MNEPGNSPMDRLGPIPSSPPPSTSASVGGEKYDLILGLADAIDATGKQLQEWAALGEEILRDDDVVDSGELSPRTWEPAEAEIRAASSQQHGLAGAGSELDADALMVRATVRTYQWIDELQAAARQQLGAIAAGALDYLAPEVELGGSLLSAGLIETDSLDREGVTAYLGELAREHPELMDHIASGGGLLESLQLRSLLTAAYPHEPEAATAGGLRAAGLDVFAADAGHALRDIGGGLLAEAGDAVEATSPLGGAPRSLEELIRALEATESSIAVQRITERRYVVYLPGPYVGRQRLRLVSGDLSDYVAEAVTTIDAKVEPGAHVMLVGAAAGGTAAVMIAGAQADGAAYVIDQVVTVGAPGAAAPRVPASTRVLSLEDRTDPIALLGGLINAAASHRVTVVYDGTAAVSADESHYVVGGRAADSAVHSGLRKEIERIRDLGFLT